jgi:protein-S-isoprenylcysteine O-methyltransferase Ste14
VTTLERLKWQGQRLFAARSIVPLAILPLVALAMPEAWRVRSATNPATSAVWLAVAVALGAIGLIVRAAALAFAPEGTSSRDTHQLRAPSLNTTGMYSIVRNPLYVGNALMWLGAVASLGLWWLVALTALLYWLYIERVILVEEGFLEGEFREQFIEWAKHTPAFVPNVGGWRPAAGLFSWKRLSNEHNGLLGFFATLTVLSLAVEVVTGGRPFAEWRASHPGLIAALFASLGLSVVLVTSKRLARRPPKL